MAGRGILSTARAGTTLAGADRADCSVLSANTEMGKSKDIATGIRDGDGRLDRATASAAIENRSAISLMLNHPVPPTRFYRCNYLHFIINIHDDPLCTIASFQISRYRHQRPTCLQPERSELERKSWSTTCYMYTSYLRVTSPSSSRERNEL